MYLIICLKKKEGPRKRMKDCANANAKCRVPIIICGDTVV